MSIATFHVKYPRKLSNPTHDPGDWMRERIMKTPDDQLKGEHYLWVLTEQDIYEESVYFLPGAFRYLIKNDDYAYTLIDPILGFISKNREQLAKDKILDDARDCIREALDYWTRQFVVIHRRSTASRNGSYGDGLQNLSGVWTMIIGLMKYGEDEDIAEDFMQNLANTLSDPLKMAWYLTLAASSRDDRKLGRISKEITSKQISILVQDKGRLRTAAAVVRNKLVPGEKSPTFWRDIFNNLGL